MKGQLSLLVHAMIAAVSGMTPLLAARLSSRGSHLSGALPLQPGALKGEGKSLLRSAPTAGSIFNKEKG